MPRQRSSFFQPIAQTTNMIPFLRYTLSILITIYLFQPMYGQDCTSTIKENKKISGLQIVRTDMVTIVVRGGYNYALEFYTDEKGIYGRMTSVGGIEFNQDDQVVFVDFTGQERAYKFISLGEVVPGNVPTHRNNLKLDLEAIQWLSGTTITGVNLVNFVDRQKYKFTINPNRQSEFRNLCVCFFNALEINAIKDTPGAAIENRPRPSQTNATASAGTGNTTTGQKNTTAPASRPSKSSAPVSDDEVTNLRAELERTKENLRNEIKLEKDRGEAIKAQLQQEVAAAREAANQKKLEYANEVLEARKTSTAEIEKAKAEAQAIIMQNRTRADSAVSKISMSVEEERRKAADDIQKARLTSAEEVQKARENAAKELVSIKEKLDQAKLQYADEIATARNNSEDELKRIRDENARIVAEARERAKMERDKTTDDVVSAKKTASEQIL